MKANEVSVGNYYWAKVSDVLTTVRLDDVRQINPKEKRYDVTNMVTGRQTTFRSAAKFRSNAQDPSIITEVQTVKKLSKPVIHQVPDTLPEITRKPSLSAKLGSKLNQSSEGPPHIIVKALAGTGKTSSLIEALKILRGEASKLTPSPQQQAIWNAVAESKDAQSICFVAFNKSIAEELKGRVPAGVDAMTMHSMGMRAINAAFNRLNLNEYRVSDIIQELVGKDIRDLRRDKPEMVKAVCELVSLCKMNLTDTSAEYALDDLASHYDIELNGCRTEVFNLVPRVLERCKDVSKDNSMDFNDMIYLPVVLNLPVKRYDLLLVDECLPGSTPVMLSDGSSKRIKEIVESDKEFTVRSYDVVTGEEKNCRVTAKQKIPKTKKMVRISVRHQSKSSGVVSSKRTFVVCTEDHKIWTTNRDWVEAGQITISDTLIIETDAKVSQEGKNPTEGRKSASDRQLVSCTLQGHQGGNGKGPTKAELSLLAALKIKSENWEAHVSIGTGTGARAKGLPTRFMLDLANVESKIAVEVDGYSHYGRRDEDVKKEEFLSAAGWNVIRVSNRRAIHEAGKVACEITRNCPKPARVTSVKLINIPDEYVYDITVEDCHNFYANGILVHNCQDLNRCQQALSKKAGKRLVFVGDSHQSIYGFCGADVQSLNRLEQELKETPRGCTVLPLTVTRRCGKAIVKEAQKYVSDFEAHESNSEGVVRKANYKAKFGASTHPMDKVPSGMPLMEQKEGCYRGQVEDGDMVICRCNGPLVSQCFKFLREGRKAQIQGRDVGQGLISTLKKVMKGFGYSEKADEPYPQEMDQLHARLSDWIHEEETKENAKRNPSESRLIGLQDRYDCLVCFTEGMKSVQAVIERIQSIFTDDKTTKGIKLSSGHRSKGLEANRVFILQVKGTQFTPKAAWEAEQEENIRYVMCTRAINELVYVVEE